MLPQGYCIRLAFSADVSCLPEVERIAGLLFHDSPVDLGLTDEVYKHVNSVEVLEQARKSGRLWVATCPDGAVVGFAMARRLGGYAHLEELDVLPPHGRLGLGAALVTAVCAWAKDSGYPGVTLRTFRDVPWNGPFYQRMGFLIVESAFLSSEHLELEVVEQRRGLRTDLRVTMLCNTTGGSGAHVT